MDKLAIELRKLKLKNRLSREPAETKYIQEDVIKESNPNGLGTIRTQKTLYEPMDLNKPSPKRESMDMEQSGPLPQEGDLQEALDNIPSYSKPMIKNKGSEFSEDQELKDIKSKLLKYKMMNQEMEDDEKKSLTPSLDRLYKGRK